MEGVVVPSVAVPVGVFGFLTMMVPAMFGWNAQVYANVPGVVKVCWYVALLRSVPESKLLSFAVTVWGASPVFVQTMVSPTLMVSILSAKSKSTMVVGMVCDEDDVGGGAGGAEIVGGGRAGGVLTSRGPVLGRGGSVGIVSDGVFWGVVKLCGCPMPVVVSTIMSKGDVDATPKEGFVSRIFVGFVLTKNVAFFSTGLPV